MYNSKIRVEIYEAFIDCLKNNVSVVSFLESNITINKSIKNKEMVKLYTDLLEVYNIKGDLVLLLEGKIPDDEMLILKLSSEAGDMVIGIQRAYDICVLKKKSVDKMFSALIGPIVMVGLVLLMIGGYSIKVFPEFEAVLPVEQWPKVSSTLYALGGFIFSFGFPVLIFAVVISLFTFNRYLKNGIGNFREKLSNLPIVSILTLNYASVFLGVLSLMIRLNVPVGHTFMNFKSTTNSRWIQKHMASMQDRQAEGLPLGDVLNTGFLPIQLVSKLALYAESADLSLAADKIFVNSQTHLSKDLDNLSAKLKTIATIIISLFAVWIYLSIMMLSNNLAP
ncbi:type II secretion system F family protein [Acinetobacter venetianus]|uniref:type II secretion system F family protein n=1 Tax=Acinetobacter venetianus TaxID=52133 RepID=UPI003A918B98